MKGKTVLFNPGFDHASIATQSVVEKQMWKLEKKTRYDYGREQFLAKVMEWKEESVNNPRTSCASRLRRMLMRAGTWWIVIRRGSRRRRGGWGLRRIGVELGLPWMR